VLFEKEKRMAQRQGKEFWQGHLESWRQSGLTQVAYCAARGLSIKTFTRWRSKERDGLFGVGRRLTLVPVCASSPITDSDLQLHSPRGWRIEMRGLALAEVAAVLRELS
jgi:hypothetical protein